MPCSKGQTRFLFEMATGTGKTLIGAGVIKLFMRTGNAKRVLFLVDRLELENQAWKAFVRFLKNDFRTVDLQREPGRLAQGGDRRHDGAEPAVQQQVPPAVLADRFRPGDFRRVAPLHQRQQPGRVRVLHRLQAGPDGHAEGLPQENRPGPHPRPRPARVGTPPIAGHVQDLRLRKRHADLPLQPGGRRARRLPAQSRGRGCPHGDHHGTARRRRLRRHAGERGRRTGRADLLRQGLREEVLLGRNQPGLLRDVPEERASRPAQRRDRQEHRLLRHARTTPAGSPRP